MVLLIAIAYILLADRKIWGYRRENGRMGVRNYVAILPLDDTP